MASAPKEIRPPEKDYAFSLTFGSSTTLDLLWVRAHVVDNLTLEVRNLKVPSFTHDVVLHSAELVELESTMTGLNCTQ